jgi:WD domain, G-beta repeat
MPRNSWTGDHMPAFRDGASSTSCVLHPIRPSILSLLQTGLLLALVVTFVVWAVGPAPTNGKTPAWSIATGHEHGVRAAAFSPDGRRLAAGGEDGCIVLWEVGKGFEKELSHHPRCGVVGLIFSRDGTTLASAHGNIEVVLWDATTGRERATLKGHMDVARGLDFSPDGATVAAGGHDGSLRLWDVASGRIKATLCGHSAAICFVRFSPDGRTLASGSVGGLVKLWDVSSGKCRHSLGPSEPRYAIASLAFSPDGLTLASGAICENTKLWDVATGLEKAAPRTEGPGVREVAFSADGQRLMAATYDGNIHLRDLYAGCEQTICLGKFSTLSSAFSLDGLLLAQGDMLGTVRIWDLNAVVNGRRGPPALLFFLSCIGTQTNGLSKKKLVELPAAHPAALRCLRLAVPPRPLVLFAPRRTSAPLRPGVVNPVSPAGISQRKRQDLPGSWGTPSVRSPCSVDAGRTARTRPLRCSSAAPGIRKARAPTKGLSTLSSMAFGLAIYASQCGLPTPHTRLASSRWSDSTGRAFYPQGSDKRFQSVNYISSSPPKLAWRNRIDRSVERSPCASVGSTDVSAK